MQPSLEWLKPVALRRTPAVLQTASEANLPHNEPRRWSCAHIMPSFVLQIGLIQTYSTSVCTDAKITLAAHPGLAHPELMRRENTRAVAALPTWQRAGLGPQTGLQSHSVRPSPQTAEALGGWLLVPAVGNNGFRSCGFTDHLATLPTAPQSGKALRRWMMQGAQSRRDTTVRKGGLTNSQVFCLSRGGAGEKRWHKGNMTSHLLNSERRLGLKQVNQPTAK